jgi:hypothetical protein
MVDTIGGRVVEFSIPDISTRFGSVKFSTELTIVERIVELSGSAKVGMFAP